MKNRILFIWASNNLSTKNNHVNAPYHFIHFGEVMDYVEKKTKSQVDYIDMEAQNIDFEYVMKKIIKKQYNVVAFYTNTENLSNSIKINKYIKSIQPNCKTIAYGDMPLYLPNFFKKTNFDFIVSRECDQEIVITDVYFYSIGKLKSDEIRGAYMILNQNLIKCKPGEYAKPEEWGIPNLEKLPLKDYFEMENKEQIVLTISRGCPYNCPYCNAVSYYGKIERRRSIDDIINYINNSKYTLYKFFAPNFTLNEMEAINLCDAIIKNGKKIKWSCTTRPDLLKNEVLIKKMKQSGCYKIAIGIESIEFDDLKNINKHYNLKNIEKGIKLLKKYNIEYKALIMFGVPKQTKKGIKRTLDFLYKNKLTVRPTAYTPYYKLKDNMNEAQISTYDKRTYYEGIENLSYGDFLKLIYDTKNYKKILKGDNDV